jgi:hypothetical protein
VATQLYLQIQDFYDADFLLIYGANLSFDKQSEYHAAHAPDQKSGSICSDELGPVWMAGRGQNGASVMLWALMAPCLFVKKAPEALGRRLLQKAIG